MEKFDKKKHIKISLTLTISVYLCGLFVSLDPFYPSKVLGTYEGRAWVLATYLMIQFCIWRALIQDEIDRQDKIKKDEELSKKA
jgi:hypothetical protein